jgi:hypothetical protein
MGNTPSDKACIYYRPPVSKAADELFATQAKV